MFKNSFNYRPNVLNPMTISNSSLKNNFSVHLSRSMKPWFLLIFVSAFFLSACSSEEETAQSESQPSTRTLDYTATVSFLNPDGSVISEIDAAVADDNHSRSQGLMDIHHLPESAGMLFIFDDEAPRSFWMASTPLSLDIFYVNEELEIVRVHQSTPPYSHESIESELPAKYVIEVNAGYALRHDITEGRSIRIDL